MNEHHKPQGEPSDVFSRAARMLAENPDSPQSLRIMSVLNASLRPRLNAVQQLVEAFAHQMETPSERSDAGVAAALAHWQAVTGASADEQLLSEMRRDAAALLESRRSRPPVLESIVAGIGQTDVGYDLGVHMHGIKGTWHRLWAAIAMDHSFGQTPEGADCIAAVRGQLEGLLGRSLSTEEWNALERHAKARAATMRR